MFVIAAFIALAAARQPGPPNDEGDSASSSSSDSLHNNVDVPHRIHKWPVPGAPAMRALVPRPRAVEVLGGAFTSGPIRNITVVDVTSVARVSGSPLKIQCEADRAWLAETLLRARESMQGISSVGGASTPSHVDRDDVYANVDAVDVRLTLLADGDVLPAAVHDEHGEIAGPEAYELTLHSGVLSIAGKRAGLLHGVRTAVQLLGAIGSTSLPSLRIVDAPVYTYRGVMIDNVRQPHSFAFHSDMLDRLAANKLNVYQLHASDDQGYSLPSTAYPTLPMSSALNTSEAKALQAKAAALGITIVAEIDLPGHSSALIKRIPSLAAHNAKTGAACAEINISSSAVMQTLQTLLSEVMEMFPSPWHHLGADEVQYNPDCGMTKTTYHHFINEMNAFVRSKNRTMIVWEGFDPNPGDSAETIDKTVVVSPFDSVHLTPWPHRPHHYYDAGYNIVNTDWNPLYLVQGGPGFAVGPDALSSWNPTKYGNYPYLGASSANWQSLPSDNWNDANYHSRFTDQNASCWPDSSQHPSTYIPQPFPSDRLLGGALCSWANPEPVEIPIIFGNCSGEGSMLPAGITGPNVPRPAPRGAIVGERLWAGALATSADVLERVGCAYWTAPPPPAPSPPPAPGSTFEPQRGACRDLQGKYSNRLDHRSVPLKFSECRAQCLKLGERCDAYDIDAPPPPSGTDPIVPWCGIWGAHITASDEDPSAGFFFYPSDGGRVCHGDVSAGKENTCYCRAPLCG